jgi:hypothetical protein
MINIKTSITFSSNRKLARCFLPDELTGLPSSLQFLCSENGVHLGTYAEQSALKSLLQQRHTLLFSSVRRVLYQVWPLLHKLAQSSRHTRSFLVCLMAVVFLPATTEQLAVTEHLQMSTHILQLITYRLRIQNGPKPDRPPTISQY